MEPTPSDLADANLIESVRQHARWQQPCDWVEADGLLMMAGANAMPYAYRNCAIRVDSDLPAAEAMARARAFFGERQRHFTMFTRDGRDADLVPVLEEAGFKQRSATPCMLVEVPVEAPPALKGVRIEGFDHVGRVNDAVDVNAEAYQTLGLPADELRCYFSQPEGLLSDDVVGFVAYVDDRPVATALTIVTGEGAGLYWVGTVNEARGRGLGAHCTLLATAAGFARGARVVTLQASPYGEPLYRRLGYRTYDWMRWYA